MALAAGTPLDPYEVLGLVGAGGRAGLHLACDSRLDRSDAVKALAAVRPCVRVVSAIVVAFVAVQWAGPLCAQEATSDKVLLVHPPGTAGQRMFSNYPLVIALHPNGSSPDALKTLLAEALAKRGRVVVALPRGNNPTGMGFAWGSVEEAEGLVTRAAESALERAKVRGEPVVLLGFAETATLACAIALRHAFNGVIAVGPGPLAPPAALPTPGATRFAVLCTQGEPNERDCSATATSIKRLGFQLDLRMLTPERARAGMDRILDALAYVTSRQMR